MFRLSFDEIVRENVVSQSYSSATLRLLPWVLFIHSASLGLLVGTFNPCIFRVIINIYVPIAIF